MATRKPTRTVRTRKAKKRGPGGRQPGAGRKALFPGERTMVGYKLTHEARSLVKAEQSRLQEEHAPHLATESAAIESLIRRAAAVPTGDDIAPLEQRVATREKVSRRQGREPRTS